MKVCYATYATHTTVYAHVGECVSANWYGEGKKEKEKEREAAGESFSSRRPSSICMPNEAERELVAGIITLTGHAPTGRAERTG